MYHDRFLSCPHAVQAQVLSDVFLPPPLVDYLAWARDNVEFTPETSPRPGKYNEEEFPYFSEILNALGQDDPCQIVTLMKSAQVGGTVAANIFTLGTMAMAPCFFLYVHPTEGNAVKWSNQKLVPLINETETLKGMFPSNSKEGSYTKLYKARRDGRGAISAAGANSPASLSMVSARKQVQDDLAKWENNAAGDPEVQADSRSKAFFDRKIFKISTPLIAPGCRISRNFEEGSQEHYHGACPHCGFLQPLKWEAMRDHLDPQAPEKAAFLCENPKCGCFIEEHHRSEFLRPVHLGGQARWVAKYPERKRFHRSFHLWVAYSKLESWAGLARKWLRIQAGLSNDADRNRDTEQVFWNDDLGLPYEAAGATLPWEDLRDRAELSGYRRGTIPKGALFLTIGVDCQADRVEWQLVGWGRRRQRFVIDYGVYDSFSVPPGGRPHSGHISEPEIRALLDALRKRTWPDFLGNKRSCDLLAIDGNAWTADVWDWAKRHPMSEVIMIRGVPSESVAKLALVKKDTDNKGQKLKYSKRLFNLAVSILKGGLYRALAKKDPDATHYVHFPSGMGDAYFRQLVCERRSAQKSRSGIVSWQWVLPEGERNEALDTMNQAEAAAIRLGVERLDEDDWDRIEAMIEVEPKAAQLDLEDVGLTGLERDKPQASRSMDLMIERARERARLNAARRGDG